MNERRYDRQGALICTTTSRCSPVFVERTSLSIEVEGLDDVYPIFDHKSKLVFYVHQDEKSLIDNVRLITMPMSSLPAKNRRLTVGRPSG